MVKTCVRAWLVDGRVFKPLPFGVLNLNKSSF